MNVYLVRVNWDVPYACSGYVIHSIWLSCDESVKIAEGLTFGEEDDSIEVQEWRIDEVMADEAKTIYLRRR